MKKIFLLILIAGLALAVYLFSAPSGFDKSLVVNVKAGSSVKEIAATLKDKGAIRSEWLFASYARVTGAQSKLIAGEHELAAKSDLRSVVKQLQSKTNLSQERSITIIEGWKISDIKDYLIKEGVVSEVEFDEAVKLKQWQNDYEFLQDRDIKSLEGFLFPDTYRIYSDATAKDIIKKMLDNFDAKLTDQMRADLKTQKQTIYEALTLASIVEREALYDDDRLVIAGIFLNRLKEGIGLQSDATVNYVTGKKTARPSYADLQVDSPYNTYKYRGLPPTPISNPGLSSIKAVIYPQTSDYFYFLTDSEGRAHFATTYAGHQANINKYLEN